MSAKTLTRQFHILIVDDDADDRLMAEEAIRRVENRSKLDFVENGEELLSYLERCKESQGLGYRYPDIILLDLNMPRKSGIEVLEEVKANPAFRHIPIIVLSTSYSEEEVAQAYDLGVNSFITKPTSFDALLNTMKIIGKYWFEIVQLPGYQHRPTR